MKSARSFRTSTFLLGLTLLSVVHLARGALPGLQLDPSNRYLLTNDGKPFFYLGDTAWELFHRCTREQAIEYLELRAKQRYNVVQAVALAELQGLDDPNR